MKKIIILTLFPNVFCEYFNSSIIKKAINKKIVDIEIVDFRKFSKDKHKSVDDTPYGGGPGMVLKIEPIVEAINHYRTENSFVILTTPSGKTFNQDEAKSFSRIENLIIICGHYEGFDERIINYIDLEVSIGDYVLTGGELPAMVIVDSIVRLYDQVLSNKESIINESFENNLLDYPVYTKPFEYQGYKVPEVLISGNHKKINEYRLKCQIDKTKKNRFDLYKKYINKIGE